MSFTVKSLKAKHGIRRYIGPKRVILFLVLMGIVFWGWNYYRSGTLNPTLIEQYRNDHPILAVALFILIYAVSVITSLPSLPLNLAAGFFWGGLLGGIYSTVGVTIGSWVSFSAARWLFGQPLAARFDSKLVNNIQQEFVRGGWKFVAFARVNPIIPTGPLNYLLGLTSISNRSFLWATFIFLSPPSIAIAYIGDTLQTFATKQSGVSEIVRAILIISAVATFLVAVKFVSRIIKKRTEYENYVAGNDTK